MDSPDQPGHLPARGSAVRAKTRIEAAVSLARLAAAVTLVGLATTALLTASETWVAVLATITIVLLMSVPLAVVYRTDGSRAFWLGFAVFGWLYLVLSFTSFTAQLKPSGHRSGHRCSPFAGGPTGPLADLVNRQFPHS